MSKYYTVEYKTTNKIKEREFNDLSKAHEFAEVHGMGEEVCSSVRNQLLGDE